MKKPPYRSYGRDKKKKKTMIEKHIDIPASVDTPEAEMMVDDVYRLFSFFREHAVIIVSIFAILLVAGGGYFGYRWYKNSLEVKAAAIFDRGMLALENGDDKEAEKYFKKVADEYFSAPSGKAGAFLYGKLAGNLSYIQKVENTGGVTLPAAARLEDGIFMMDKGKGDLAVKRFASLSRNRDWTYPAGLYYMTVYYLSKGEKDKAKDTYEILRGDYKNSFYTAVLGEIIQ
ncbi:tetratricopeptide repeat protein [Desulfurobacterium sp.]